MRKELKFIEILNESIKFVEENFEELQKRYPNEFIAVRGNKVLAHAKNPKTLLKRLEKKGEDLVNVLIEFIPERGVSVIY